MCKHTFFGTWLAMSTLSLGNCKAMIGLPFYPKIVHFQLSSTASTKQKVPKNTHFSRKSKAIGLPFYPKIVHFQLSSTGSTKKKVPKNSHFSLKSKAIGLPFYPKIVHFQLSSTATAKQKVPKNAHFSPISCWYCPPLAFCCCGCWLHSLIVAQLSCRRCQRRCHYVPVVIVKRGQEMVHCTVIGLGLLGCRITGYHRHIHQFNLFLIDIAYPVASWCVG